MKYFFLIVAILIFSALLTPLASKLHARIEKSCNDTGGSYLWGMCIHNEYNECHRIMTSQGGPIAALPMRCVKYAERLFRDQ